MDDADGMAYLIPRPDGSSCLPEGQRQYPEINALALTDALLAVRCLHAGLRFVAVEGEAGLGDVSPSAIPEDIVEICERFPDLAVGALQDPCTRCRVQAIRSPRPGAYCDDLYVPYTLAEAELLAEKLNEIYGIE